jgi:hypothetical protein
MNERELVIYAFFMIVLCLIGYSLFKGVIKK